MKKAQILFKFSGAEEDFEDNLPAGDRIDGTEPRENTSEGAKILEEEKDGSKKKGSKLRSALSVMEAARDKAGGIKGFQGNKGQVKQGD